MAFRHRVIRGVRRQVRETMWISIDPVDNTIGAASTASLVSSLNAAGLALRPFTIVRTHLTAWFGSDQVAASEVWGAAIAFAVVSESASAAGAALVPTPITEKDSDLFFLYHEEYGQFAVTTAVGTSEPGRGAQIDSKAMRKVNNDEDIVLVEETPALVSSCEIITSGRMLIKLH